MCKDSPFLRRFLLTVSAAVVLAPSSALANERSYVWTYDWYVPFMGESEVEMWGTDFGGGRSDIALEFERGVDGHYAIAPYVLLSRSGSDYRVDGWKIEQRYAFGRFGYDRILPAAYLEVKKQGNEEYVLEGKLITTVEFKDGWSWSGNLFAEGKAKGNTGVEWEYATGLSRPLGYNANIGVEAFGSFTEKESFIGPTSGLRLGIGRKLLAGYGFATNGGPGRLRVLFEAEF